METQSDCDYFYKRYCWICILSLIVSLKANVKCYYDLNYKYATVNYASPYVGVRGIIYSCNLYKGCDGTSIIFAASMGSNLHYLFFIVLIVNFGRAFFIFGLQVSCVYFHASDNIYFGNVIYI